MHYQISNMDVEVFIKRLKRLRDLMKEKNIGSFFVSHPANRRYLSGFKVEDPQVGETAGVLLISQEKSFLFTDPRYADLAIKEAKGWEICVYHLNLFEEIEKVLKEMPPPLGFEANHLNYKFYQRLKEIYQNEIVPTENLIESLRQIKEKEEIDAIKKALSMTEEIFLNLKDFLKPGLIEKEVAWWIEEKIRLKYKAELSFPPIVASGENSAIPHAVPTERKIRENEPIIIDFGLRWEGYCADMTRTFYLSEPDEKFKKIYETVFEAQKRALNGIKAGLKTDEADALARDFFKEKGLEEAFKHSLGHGVGILVHERPALSPRKPALTLKRNMVVTIEPGLYFSEWGGVRIEDMVVIEENGCERLNKTSNELKDWVIK
ncbi:MAG TPA: aminopeptidase P family protein [Candidatus Desulfofervidus auxilii]|uniref:Aminopeptidase P family protein n=1 Tax=Desulfofervidus auxilii TaxID=1621989 RepID=A0A7C0Y4W4_DESA2|nr:aminopeptidase P family protein [Candidatus Desulfofervidus auxilii]